MGIKHVRPQTCNYVACCYVHIITPETEFKCLLN